MFPRSQRLNEQSLHCNMQFIYSSEVHLLFNMTHLCQLSRNLNILSEQKPGPCFHNHFHILISLQCAKMGQTY